MKEHIIITAGGMHTDTPDSFGGEESGPLFLEACLKNSKEKICLR